MGKYYDEEVTRDIKSRLDIVDLIAETVQLKRKGNRYWGLCPFHEEKTPSFSVSQDKQVFYCFGCHAGGDIFSFIMKKDGLDFKETLALLAQKAGIQLEAADHEETDRRRKIIAVNTAAVDFYSQMLSKSAGRLAHAYTQKRGIAETTISTFLLGYAPDSWNALSEYLLKAGFSLTQMQAAGLVKCNENRNSYFDLFRHRLIFPILNQNGEPVAFGGRALDDNLPKYLNSPETEIFSKRKNLYGLYHARESIRRKNEAILVEGYMDCIKMHQAGIDNVVSSLGTAFTLEQAHLLHRYAEKVMILYDGDEAGQRETLKAAEILSREKVKIEIVTLPAGKDPDEFLHLAGKKEFWHYITNNINSYIEFKINSYIKSTPVLDIESKARILQDFQDDIIQLDSELEKDYYIKLLARKLRLEENVIYRQFGIIPGLKGRYMGRRNKIEIIRDNNKYGNYGIQEKIITAMLVNDETFNKIKASIGLDFFKNENYRSIVHLYDSLEGKSAEKLEKMQQVASQMGLGSITARLCFYLDEGIIARPDEITEFIYRVQQLREKTRWDNLYKLLNKLSGNENFNNILEFILKLDAFLNQHPGRGDKTNENR